MCPSLSPHGLGSNFRTSAAQKTPGDGSRARKGKARSPFTRWALQVFATMHFEIATGKMLPAAQEQFEGSQKPTFGEAHRIREFIDETRTLPTPGDGVVKLSPELYKRIAGLREQWTCKIELKSVPCYRNLDLRRPRIRHILTAVSNPVRHGRASRIRVTVCRLSDRLIVRIWENGNGLTT